MEYDAHLDPSIGIGHGRPATSWEILRPYKKSVALKHVRTGVTERIGFAEHFGRLGPLSLPDETLGGKVATHDTHVDETRDALLLLCSDIDHGSRADGKACRKCGLAGLALYIKRDGGGFRGEGTGEKALCTGVSMGHEVRLGEPKRVVRVICYLRVSGKRTEGRTSRRTGPGENFVAPKRGGVVQVLHESIMAPEAHAVDYAPLDVFVVLIGRDLEHIRVVVGQGMPAEASLRTAIRARR
jgi:hypothetical protein